MEKLKKILTLNEAAKISGYHPDYLSALIRKGEIKGEKTGGTWFTSEDEIKNYIFKQKVRRRKWAIFDFFSETRTKRIVWATFIIFLLIFGAGVYFFGASARNNYREASTTLSPEAEVIEEIVR